MLGCSSKPDVSDVKQVIADGWGACPLVKPINIKKVNGLQQGDGYQLAISYELEFQMDTPEKDPAQQFIVDNCKPFNMAVALGSIILTQEKGGTAIKKGELLQLAPVFNMLKSDNGWIIGSTQ
jgi:hypothetical protein